MHALLATIGNTPLVRLAHLSPRPGIELYAKLEGANPTGSVKDRVALAMVEDAEARGLLRPGMTVVEATTGNTGVALTTVARQRGYGCTLVVPENVVPGMGELLRTFGAELIWSDAAEGIEGAREIARQLGAVPDHYHPDQFSNPANVRAHYEHTGAEIIQQLPEVDVFVCGLGTGGTVTGVGRRLKEHNPAVKVLGVEPYLGAQLQGLKSMRDGFLPPNLDMSLLDGAVLVRTQAAFRATRRLLHTEGVFAGISAGAALHGALRWVERTGIERANIVVLFADGGWKYLGTGAYTQPLSESPDDDGELDDIIWW
ncbi:MAG: cysteine synthase family protein [Chloroflexi bacterium]|nr:cysteine synthase family protein [Chloroflexota bacterium]